MSFFERERDKYQLRKQIQELKAAKLKLTNEVERLKRNSNKACDLLWNISREVNLEDFDDTVEQFINHLNSEAK